MIKSRTFAEAVREMTRLLEAGFCQQEAKVLALRLFSERLGVPEYRCWMDPQMPVAETVCRQWEQDIRQLLEQRPWQYVVGRAEFDGHTFAVNESVLIPRPETEELLRLAVDRVQSRWGASASWLDLCTGSGCLAWSLAARFPQAKVGGVDLSEAALSVASSQSIPVRSPFFLKADLLAEVPAELGTATWCALISNPPYVRVSEQAQMASCVLDYEPSMALFVPDEDPLLFYRALTRWAQVLLRPGGQVFWEINEAFGEELCQWVRSQGFVSVQLCRDFRDRPRFILFEK